MVVLSRWHVWIEPVAPCSAMVIQCNINYRVSVGFDFKPGAISYFFFNNYLKLKYLTSLLLPLIIFVENKNKNKSYLVVVKHYNYKFIITELSK